MYSTTFKKRINNIVSTCLHMFNIHSMNLNYNTGVKRVVFMDKKLFKNTKTNNFATFISVKVIKN